MLKKSGSRHTNIRRNPPASGEIKTIEDFVRILQSALVDRVVLEDKTTYLKTPLGAGSQFSIYDDKGISTALHSDLPPAAIKCVRLQLAQEGGRVAPQDSQHRRVSILLLRVPEKRTRELTLMAPMGTVPFALPGTLRSYPSLAPRSP